MKTTRRNLLRFIGIGAAAAAFAPSVGQAEGVDSVRPVVPPGDVHIDSYWQGWDDGNQGLKLAHDAVEKARAHGYEQGRADGYNRGREVESAAWEARQGQWNGLWGRFVDMSKSPRTWVEG